ncbi:CapA family protein [Paenibacillus marinisediminis]
MDQSRTESRRQQREKRKRKRNKLFVINLLLFVLVVGAIVGGQMSGLLDIRSIAQGGLDMVQGEPAQSGPSSQPSNTSTSGKEQSTSSSDKSSGMSSGSTVNKPVDDQSASGKSDKGQTAGSASKPSDSKPGADEDEGTVLLTFVGDIINAGKVADVVETKGYDFPYRYATDMFKNDDLTIANLETPITSGGVPAKDKEFVYKSNPKMAPAMKEAGIDVVNLANNHSMDQGKEGLLDTFAALKKAEIGYVGAGKDMTEAYSPYIIEKKGMKIAVFGFTRVIPHVSWYSGKKDAGLAATYEPDKAVEAIKRVREDVDLVIVVPHWGEERKDTPVEYQKSLAKAYIDAGADLIVGGHPHVVQGIESYKGKWIAYSMGNFIFTKSTEPKTWETMVLQAECSKDGKISLKLVPYYTEIGQAVPMKEDAAQKLLKRVESISYGVKIDSEGRVTSK